MMRAIGAVSKHIMSMFMLEAVIQGLMSWLIAMPIALFVTPIMADALGQTMFNSRLEYQFNLSALFIWLAIILVISVLASIIPPRNAANINVRQSLSYE
jgi:putative ABC transport system permease protein